MKRLALTLAAAAGAALLAGGCSAISPGLTDAETLWCGEDSNYMLVWDTGYRLGLGPPGHKDGYVSIRWDMDPEGVDGWSLHPDSAEYIRACKAAYELRAEVRS